MGKRSLFDDFDEEIDFDISEDSIGYDNENMAETYVAAETTELSDDISDDLDDIYLSDNMSEADDANVFEDVNDAVSDEASTGNADSEDEAILSFLEKRRAKMIEEGEPVYTSANRVKEEKTEEFVPAKKLSVGKIIARVSICIGTTLGLILITLLIAIALICRGPSEMVRDMFVSNMVQTGQMDFLAYIFLSDEEVDKIVKLTEPVTSDEKTDTSLIQIGGVKPDDDSDKNDESDEDDNSGEIDINALEIVDIKGKTYKGKMLIVNDPSRVSVGTAAAYGENCVGYTTLYMAQSSNSIAAINGGGYVDKASNKTGGIPMGRDESGIVIANGELKYGNLNSTYEIIGLDKNGILHVDNMTAKEALDKGIRDAVNWGPILVKNGEACTIASDGSNLGFHPRSAIGQRSDGAILLLVIDGRQSNSLGASYSDLIEIMVDYGAVNAANLDGGMSSYMVYENKIITEPYLLYDPRNVATSWLVSRVEGE